MHHNAVKNQSGQAMIIIAFFMAVLALAGAAGVTFFTSATSNIASFENQQKTYYAAAGIQQRAELLLESYILVNPQSITNVPAADTAALQGAIGSCVSLPCTGPLNNIVTSKFPGFTLLNNQVQILSENQNGIIPTGPYAGLGGALETMGITIQVQQDSTGDISTITNQVTIAQIPAFEFLLFSDLDSPESVINPSIPTSYDGRVHANNNLCLGGSALLKILDVTSSGNIYDIANPFCNSDADAGALHTEVATVNDTNFTLFAPLIAGSTDSGCVNCNGESNVNWIDYAVQTWGANVLDSAMGVQDLSTVLPVGNHPQNGYDQIYAPTSNTKTSRSVIDPPLLTDPPTVGNTKLAMTAVIRIIDGVWYIRTQPSLVPVGVLDWPGTPIWSDHPGRYQDPTFGLNVGQQDIADYWAAHGRPWAGIPQGFSYYAYDNTAGVKSISDAPNAMGSVISYGNITQAPLGAYTNHLGSTPGQFWYPAGFVNAGGGQSICPSGQTLSCPSFVGDDLLGPFSAPGLCSCAGNPVAPSSQLLNATRGGFRDFQIFNAPPTMPNGPGRANMLPVNFDMGAFLYNVRQWGAPAGELGSYFGAGGLWSSFNGIVYISYNYPGSMKGFSPISLAGDHPQQGANTDASQPSSASVTAEQQNALPYPMCSNATGAAPAGYAGQNFDSAGQFVIPDCATYSPINAASPTPGVNNAFINSVRIINGTTLKQRATLLSNMPVYIVGDYNTLNATTNTASDTTNPLDTTNWMASWVGGDFVSVLSNAYVDKNGSWTTAAPPANATTTNVNTVIMSGLMKYPGTPYAGLQGVPAFQENWQAGASFNFWGSIDVGYYPVYYGAPISSTAFLPPGGMNINFDPHYSIGANQPPGAHTYSVFSISKWIGN